MKTKQSKLIYSIFIICFFLLIQENTIHAQERDSTEGVIVFVDEAPTYKKWKREYIITKIVYTNTETIFYFTFKPKTSSIHTSAIFYPLNHNYSWVLVDHENELVYHPTSIEKITKNGILKYDKIGEEKITVSTHQTGSVFTCEVHFDRFSEKVKTVDLLEGISQKKNKNHFNAFSVQLKYRTPPK